MQYVGVLNIVYDLCNNNNNNNNNIDNRFMASHTYSIHATITTIMLSLFLHSISRSQQVIRQLVCEHSVQVSCTQQQKLPKPNHIKPQITPLQYATTYATSGISQCYLDVNCYGQKFLAANQKFFLKC